MRTEKHAVPAGNGILVCVREKELFPLIDGVKFINEINF
jgi:uncharacterized protein YbaR (Trm112 family)